MRAMLSLVAASFLLAAGTDGQDRILEGTSPAALPEAPKVPQPGQAGPSQGSPTSYQGYTTGRAWRQYWLDYCSYRDLVDDVRDDIERDFQRMRDRRLDALEDRVGSLEELLRGVDGRLGELDRRIESLRGDLAEVSGRLGDVAASLPAAGDAVRRADFDSAFRTMLEDLSGLRREMEEVSARLGELNELGERVNRLEASVQGLSDELADLDRRPRAPIVLCAWLALLTLGTVLLAVGLARRRTARPGA